MTTIREATDQDEDQAPADAPINSLLASACVESGSAARTAPFHAAGHSRRRQLPGTTRCCFRPAA
jgi:hypothetical protein